MQPKIIQIGATRNHPDRCYVQAGEGLPSQVHEADGDSFHQKWLLWLKSKRNHLSFLMPKFSQGGNFPFAKHRCCLWPEKQCPSTVCFKIVTKDWLDWRQQRFDGTSRRKLWKRVPATCSLVTLTVLKTRFNRWLKRRRHERCRQWLWTWLSLRLRVKKANTSRSQISTDWTNQRERLAQAVFSRGASSIRTVAPTSRWIPID